MNGNSDNAQIHKTLETIQIELADLKREVQGVKSEVYSFRDLISDLIGIYSGKRVRKEVASVNSLRLQ